MNKLALFLIALSSFAASVPELVNRMPDFGPDARLEGPAWDEARGIFEELLSGGETAVLALVDMLVEPGNTPNVKPRNVLHGLAQYLARDTHDAQRQAFLKALDKAVMDDKRAPAIRSFLLRQMQVCGGTEALALLSAYIAKPKLAAEAGAAVIDLGKRLGDADKEAVRVAVSEALIVVSDNLRKEGEQLLEKLGGEVEPPSSKVYMERQVAQTMHWLGADWLLRAVREREEATSVMIRALELKPGQVIADVGCGNGYHSLMMARLVGETGKVYGVDIQQEMLTMLKKRAADAGVDNVVPVLGKFWDPNLPANSIDVALIVDAYHEFSHPARMLRGIYKALKPDGVVVFLEYRTEDPKVPIKRLHKMSKAQVDKELTANGFKLVKSFDDLPWQHMLWYGKE